MLRAANTGCSCRNRAAGWWWPLSPRKRTFSLGGSAAGAAAANRTKARNVPREVRIAALLRTPAGGARGPCPLQVTQPRGDGVGQVLDDPGHRPLPLVP